MFTNIFLNRDPKLKNVIKLCDSIGRSLRENVEIFSIEGNEISFLTESNFIIKGNLSKDGKTLENLTYQSSEVFEDPRKCDELANEKVGSFIRTIYKDNFSAATDSFSSLLSVWESRLKFFKTRSILEEKKEKLSLKTSILNTPEFEKLQEVTSHLINLLSENKETISKIPEIKNAVQLSDTISQAFNIPKLTIEELVKKPFSLKSTMNESVYEIICQQELLGRELLESKKEFDQVWAHNKKISKLASLVYSEDQEEIEKTLSEAIKEVPFLALATKKQLVDTFSSNLRITETVSLSERDVKDYVSVIFEMKKPVRSALLNLLNEKYGINVSNLKDPPTFRSLLDTQVVVFDSLSKLVNKNSVLKNVLSEVSKVLKEKSGVESIDVNDYLYSVFEEAGYTDMLNESTLMKYLDFDRVASDLGEIGQVLKMIQMGAMQQGGGMNPGMPGAPTVNVAPPQQPGMPGSPMGGGAPNPAQMKQEYADDETLSPEQSEEGGMPATDPATAAAGAKQDMSANPEMGGAAMTPGGEGPPMQDSPEVGQNVMTTNMQELEALLADLTAALQSAGIGGAMTGMGEPGMEQPMGDEGIPGEEGEMEGEEGIDQSGGAGGPGDDVVIHNDIESHDVEGGEEEDEESGESDFPPKKDKKPSKEKSSSDKKPSKKIPSGKK